MRNRSCPRRQGRARCPWQTPHPLLGAQCASGGSRCGRSLGRSHGRGWTRTGADEGLTGEWGPPILALGAHPLGESLVRPSGCGSPERPHVHVCGTRVRVCVRVSSPRDLPDLSALPPLSNRARPGMPLLLWTESDVKDTCCTWGHWLVLGTEGPVHGRSALLWRPWFLLDGGCVPPVSGTCPTPSPRGPQAVFPREPPLWSGGRVGDGGERGVPLDAAGLEPAAARPSGGEAAGGWRFRVTPAAPSVLGQEALDALQVRLCPCGEASRSSRQAQLPLRAGRPWWAAGLREMPCTRGHPSRVGGPWRSGKPCVRQHQGPRSRSVTWPYVKGLVSGERAGCGAKETRFNVLT